MARQRKKGNPIVNATIFGIIGVVFLVMGVRTFIGMHGTLLNVTTCDPSDIKPGMYVEGNISYGYGAYVEKTTTYNHIVTKTDGYYYLVDICDKNADGTAKDSAKWIGISISKSEKDKFDAISESENAEPIQITGVVRSNSSKIQGFLDEYITKYVDAYASYYGYTPTSADYESAKAEALPYYIEIVDSFDYIFEFGIGLICVIFVIFNILKVTRNKNHIGVSAQPAGQNAGYYDGTGDFNGINNSGDMYQPNSTSGTYNSETGNTNDSPVYGEPHTSSSFSLKTDD